MEELDLDNILSGDEIATLFEEPPKKEPKEEPKEEKKEETTDFDEDNPFGTSQKESVGSEDEDIQGKGDTDNNGVSSSPTLYAVMLSHFSSTAFRTSGMKR